MDAQAGKWYRGTIGNLYGYEGVTELTLGFENWPTTDLDKAYTTVIEILPRNVSGKNYTLRWRTHTPNGRDFAVNNWVNGVPLLYIPWGNTTKRFIIVVTIYGKRDNDLYYTAHWQKIGI